MKNNFIFFGTPDVASQTLEILKLHSYLPTLIVTAPDRPRGRKLVLTPPPAKLWAIENKIPYIQPEKITDEVIDSLPEVDLYIVIAYGKILKEKLIHKPRLGSINIHYSLLPKYRGASPLESALLHGDMVTGISIQQMEFKMDSGPILKSVEVPIADEDTILELKPHLINLGAKTLVEILPKILNQEIKATSQDESQATFCTKIKKEDALVDLEKDAPTQIWHKYKAYRAWPRIYFMKDNKRIVITKAEFSEGKFCPLLVIPEGKKEISWGIFIRNN